MFTRKRIPAFQPTGDWARDAPGLMLWLQRYLGSLEEKNALTISQAQIFADQGIQFPAVQVASSDANNLDDYAEGSWTPVLTFATPGDLAVTYAVRTGHYTKIGNAVFATFGLTTSSFTWSTASGACRITGIPFSLNSTDANYLTVGALAWQGVTKAGYTQGYLVGSSGSAFFQINMSGSAQPVAALAAADMPSGGTVVLRGGIYYIV